jgi:integrative and conjugative element protein (TIGR02256 family)
MSATILTRHAYDQLLAEAQQAADGTETGGVLLGRDGGMGSGFMVRHCGDPGPQAVREPASFRRDLAHAQMLAERVAELDGSVWIGEWHTHLHELPVPSGLDLMTYRGLLNDTEIDFPRFLSLILLYGPDGSWSKPRIFAWSVSASSMRPLAVRAETDPDRPQAADSSAG